ncbi:hypothetical protein [Gordonia rhizosphera]|uniref:Uncharacterized protein n=1 Tax=Gordonia rhizosphera NBRC 16068 TaxID=1108045 RepID=K6VVN5_9ACTN|nr:hypothetical protein [Gordonia rhizosphera]GAB90955.1 hypothetical protein GORHZ_120_00110 [Gordonia rhizosphera NBRC 16068]
MTDDDDPDRGGLADKDSRERVLAIVLALVGALVTLASVLLPVVAGVPHRLVFGVVVASLNLVGYLVIVSVAAQSPLQRTLIRRSAWAVIAVSVSATVWSVLVDGGASGADFLVATSGSMAAMVLLTSHLVADGD